MVFMAYGALLVRVVLAPDNTCIRKGGAILSGLGLVFIFVAGFAMLGKGGFGFPAWAITKIVLWVVLGGLLVFINKKPQLNKALWIITLLVGLLAVSFGVVKPF